MLNIGCHLSTTKVYNNMGKEALTIGANTFQFFTRNPRGGKAKDIDENDIKKLIELMDENKFSKILAHAPYTLNACSKDESTRQFALEMMEDDLKRMEYLPNNLYNFHPGSHVKQGTEVGIEFIAVAEIISRVELKEHMGVCLDTCHVYDAGYDIVNDLDNVLDEFDKIIGLDRLYAIHLNDSKNPFSSHKDRHEKIGEGSIGLEAVTRIINHPKLKNIPFFLETPNELDGYAKEISMLRDAYID